MHVHCTPTFPSAFLSGKFAISTPFLLMPEGPVIWENPGYVSPNDLRAAEKRKAAGKYTGKVRRQKLFVCLLTHLHDVVLHVSSAS